MKYIFGVIKQAIVSTIALLCFVQGCGFIVIYQIFIVTFYSRSGIKSKQGLKKSKEAFIILLMCVLGIVAPSSIRITTDSKTMKEEQFWYNEKSKKIESKLNPHSILIANHQLYTDWIYIWRLLYSSKFGGDVYIFAKKALKNIPVFGYAMMNYKFVFLNRSWAQDKDIIESQLVSILDNSYFSIKSENAIQFSRMPYCFILFPEGTTLSQTAREKSDSFATALGRKTFNHVLAPHTKGLKLVLGSLNKNVDKVYDITIGYSGVKADTYGEEQYSLSNIFLRGKSPLLTDIYIKAIKVKDIPYHNDKEFEDWLFKIWEEKDQLLKDYYEMGAFNLKIDSSQTIIDPFDMSTTEYLIALFFPLAFGMILLYIFLQT